MQVALHERDVNKGEFCPPFPEPENLVEWIPFHGSFTSSSGSSSCSESDVTGSGSSEGSYLCGDTSETSETIITEEDEDSDRDKGSYAPGVGQKPAPAPKPKPTPAPAPPPAAPPPSGGVTP
jgi:hypothetical protein